MELDQIRHKAMFGFFWEISSRIFEYIITFICGLIMIRILNPYDYGLIAYTQIFFIISQLLTDGGISAYLIQLTDTDDLDFSTAFVANVLVALFLYFILFFVSPLIAQFYKDNNLTLVLRISGLSIIINSLNLVPSTKLVKSLEFKKISFLTISKVVGANAIGLTFAFFSFKYWSLVALSLSTSVIAFIYLNIFSGYKYQFNFSFEKIKKMYSVSSLLLIIQFMHGVAQEIYTVVLGRYYNTNQVGYYSRAVQTHQIFNNTIVYPITSILFPVFSKLKDNLEIIKDTIIRIINIVAFVNFSILIYLGIYSYDIFIILFTEKWIFAQWIFVVLIISYALMPLSNTFQMLLPSQGKIKYYFYTEVIIKSLQAITILIFIKSFFLIILGISIFEVVRFLLRLHFAKKIIPITFSEVFVNLSKYILNFVVIALTSFFIRSLTLEFNIYLRVILGFIIVVLISFAMGKLLKLKGYYEVVGIISEFIPLLKEKLGIKMKDTSIK